MSIFSSTNLTTMGHCVLLSLSFHTLYVIPAAFFTFPHHFIGLGVDISLGPRKYNVVQLRRKNKFQSTKTSVSGFHV